MFSLTIALGPVQWRLMFRSQETAKAVFDDCCAATPLHRLDVSDDFGQRCVTLRTNITGVLLEDLQQSKLAQQELLLYGERVRHAAMMAAQSDPQLRQHPAPRGPAVLTPMGMNGVPRG